MRSKADAETIKGMRFLKQRGNKTLKNRKEILKNKRAQTRCIRSLFKKFCCSCHIISHQVIKNLIIVKPLNAEVQ